MNNQWKLVPVEPTETMVINGFESVPDECFTDEEVWERYQKMSGCQQAAFRAKLCWAAMIAAVPTTAPETVKSGGEPKPYPDRLCHIDYTAHPYSCGCLSGDNEAQRRFDEHLRDTKLATAESEVARLRAELDALQQHLNAVDQRSDELEQDKHRLDALESNCWDVRFGSSPNGNAGDSSINIEVVGHWMDKPFERVIGENYSENLRAAIDQAMAAPAYSPARSEYPEIDEAFAAASIS